MSNNHGDILRNLDGPDSQDPPFDQIVPYPRFLVVNIYGGYELLNGKTICLNDVSQTPIAQKLQLALQTIGIAWNIEVHKSVQEANSVGVCFEIRDPVHKDFSYELEIETYGPNSRHHQQGKMTLAAVILSSLEMGVDTLIQVIRLAFDKFGKDVASLWIMD